jgi:4-hydroxythreonine-4-phosphate dehydrogenase
MSVADRAPEPAGAPGAPVAVSMGDPAGIGLDVTLASWLDRRHLRLPPFVLYAELAAVRERARQLGFDIPLAEVEAANAARTFATALPVHAVGGSAPIVGSIEEATAAVARGEASALLTNPIAKNSLQGGGLEYPGHTAFLGVLAARHWPGRTYRPVMMLACEALKVVPVTVHIPLAAVPAALTTPLLLDTIRITAAALTGDFGIARPRIAVAGLNPHAGEGGMIGTEEERVIAPATAKLAAEGLSVRGPYPADTLFHATARAGYDAAVAMYHDQALIPLKTLDFERGVNVTLGLPFVRTSPDHGTAYALAGTGKARPDSFIAALRLAVDIARRRAGTHTP